MTMLNIVGEALAEEILRLIGSVGLDMGKCIGQAYDGASNMSGQRNGTAAIICQQFPKASYSHCRSHKLNLALMKSCSSIQPISKSKWKYIESCLLPV